MLKCAMSWSWSLIQHCKYRFKIFRTHTFIRSVWHSFFSFRRWREGHGTTWVFSSVNRSEHVCTVLRTPLTRPPSPLSTPACLAPTWVAAVWSYLLTLPDLCRLFPSGVYCYQLSQLITPVAIKDIVRICLLWWICRNCQTSFGNLFFCHFLVSPFPQPEKGLAALPK